MKSIIFVLNVNDAVKNAVLKTNDDGNSNRFTVMQVEKPDELNSDIFPFRVGDVLNIQDVLKFAGMSNKRGILSITKLVKEDATNSEEIQLPLVSKVTITIPENSIITINGEKQEVEELKWEGYLFKGESLIYKVELDGENPEEEKIISNGEDINIEVEFS